MKKKGLIIATIVMVLVLAVSLTTATYAWFTASSVTKIDAFNVSIASNNAVKIGVKANNTYAAGAGEDAFLTGTVSYTAGTAGTLGGGSWGGDQSGLSATIEHNIKWGEQSKAIGFATSSISETSGATSLLGSLSSTINTTTGGGHTQGEGYVYAANGDNTASTLTNITAAIANNNGVANENLQTSDYVYLFLGAAPTRDLTTNELVILLDGNSGSGVTIGVLAAVHVAYRLNSNGAWTDARIFSGNDNQTPTPAAITNLTRKTYITSNLSAAEAQTYVDTYGGSAPTTGARALIISGLATTKDQIDQIEILIYIDGTDSNCNQNAIAGVGGAISIFFHTTEPNS